MVGLAMVTHVFQALHCTIPDQVRRSLLSQQGHPYMTALATTKAVRLTFWTTSMNVVNRKARFLRVDLQANMLPSRIQTGTIAVSDPRQGVAKTACRNVAETA